MLHFLVSKDDKQTIGAGLDTLATCYSPLFPDVPCEVEVTLVDSAAIRHLNNDHRHVDTPTDVLSFPLYHSLEQIPAGIPCLLGSVVICPEQVEHYDETLVEMVHHALLHLTGEDHETDRAAWDIKEEEALAHLQGSGLHINPAPR